MRAVWLLLPLAACGELDTNTLNDDQDGDGYTEFEGDCDDNDRPVFPGAATQDPTLCTRDADGDGYDDALAAEPLDAGTDCDDNDAALDPTDDDGDGYSTCDGDCDNADGSLNPDDDDGYSTCDGDCRDDDETHNLDDDDGDGFLTCDGDCNDALMDSPCRRIDAGNSHTCAIGTTGHAAIVAKCAE